MDIISYECAKNVNDILAIPMLKVCKQHELAVYRFPVTGSGGHATSPYVDIMYYDDNPANEDDDTIIAPNWDNLRKCLYSLNPSDFIVSEFEAIENIDEYAYKLVDYVIIKKEQRKNDYRL